MDAPKKYTDDELVILLKQGKTAAYAYLYDEYAAALYGIILRIIEDKTTGRDLLQVTLLKIWRNIHSYDPARGSLFSWMLTIARNSALDMLNSSHYKHSRLMTPVDGNLMQVASPDTTNHQHLREIIRRLKAEHRIVIELSYFQGYTQQQIAEILNIPLGTVKTRLEAAKVALRKMI